MVDEGTRTVKRTEAKDSEESVKKDEGTANRIRRARERCGLTQQQLGEEIGRSKRSIQKYESGETEPGPGLQDEIAAATGVRYEWLRTGEGEMRREDVGEPPTDKTQQSVVPSGRPEIPIYDIEASAGNGGDIVSEDPLGYLSPSDSSPIFEVRQNGSKMCFVVVHGDSMRPTLARGQMAPVRRFNPPLDHIPDDGVYVFRWRNEVFIKRLRKMGRDDGYRLRMISDNQAYEHEDIIVDEGVDFAVLGEVLT